MPNDILLGDDLDLAFENGDLLVGESTNQHTELILLVEKGALRDSPFRGVGVGNWILDEFPANIAIEAKRQLQLDGQRVDTCRYNDSGLEIVSDYA
jgi:hypothetical protein